MKYYFDFDNTLVETHQLIEYRGNSKGRYFLTTNADLVPTMLVNEKLVGIIKNLGSNVAIITNSPQDYVAAFLKKHGFPEIQIMGNAGKPCSKVHIESPAVYIGDEPLDILFAHERKIPSIVYTESSFFPCTNIEQSQPTAIAKTADDLERILSENLVYKPRQLPNLVLLDKIIPEDIPIHYVQEYHTSKSPQFESSGSQHIITYKRANNFDWVEIMAGKKDSFFYQGSIIEGASFSKIIDNFYARLKQKVAELNLNGTVRMLPIPNSLPEFCYFSDVNYNLSFRFNNKASERDIYRTRPVREAHLKRFRSPMKHLGTLGLNPYMDKT